MPPLMPGRDHEGPGLAGQCAPRPPSPPRWRPPGERACARCADRVKIPGHRRAARPGAVRPGATPLSASHPQSRHGVSPADGAWGFTARPVASPPVSRAVRRTPGLTGSRPEDRPGERQLRTDPRRGAAAGVWPARSGAPRGQAHRRPPLRAPRPRCRGPARVASWPSRACPLSRASAPSRARMTSSRMSACGPLRRAASYRRPGS